MRRFLRLLTLWLIALALPIQGAAAAAAMPGHANAPHTMTMPDGTTMDAADMPCHAHAIDKAGCGACCGPIVTQQAMLAVAPVATRWAVVHRDAADAASPLFLTGGTERPPRFFLA
ncbi:hypothetical protein [Scleromatobacter humisilvae]|uniref:DUF2946 domain-containing protein n=1 Tax=Scleromatobacter humisilvae TaxID=2897159 RepID=A0A9X2C0S7_9BURK|nr:hypothetical protein [Scleromatobacter humisilvae]MCK9688128.1 hypothetical protein [Scleromatobacter humisilvae]